MNLQKFETSLTIPISYIHINKGENKPVVLMFHGFADSAKSFLKRALPEISTEVEVLAINGPFPIPQKKGNEWRHAFAWYFADQETQTVYIHPKVAAQAITDLLVELKLIDRKKIMVGFSQGGFFIPHLLSNINNILKLLIIGAAYRPEDYPENKKWHIEALHGEKDEVIAHEQAKKTFSLLNEKKLSGEFHTVPAMGHDFNSEAQLWLKNKIESALL